MNVTGRSKGLVVTAGSSGVVSHAGLVLLRALADGTGLTAGLSKALATRRLLVHDRGRVLADLAAVIADGAEVISDFAVLAHQRELFGPVASVPTVWRALDEIAAGGPRAQARITRALNAARRRTWAGIEARHGALPGITVADKVIEGVTCIRLDATVIPAHSEKEGAEPNFKGFGHHPLLGYCDNTDEPLAGMLRPGDAGPNTVADHLQVLDAAITAVPPKFRRRLMVTCDGAGASHGLITRLDDLAARPGRQLVYSVGWGLGDRERAAITLVPRAAWQIAIGPPAARGSAARRRAAAIFRARMHGAGLRRRTSPSSPGCCAKAPAVTSSPGGPPACGSSPAGSVLTLARSYPCSKSMTAGDTACTSRTCPPARAAGVPRTPISTQPTACTRG
jgi:hypothetical protein